MLFAKILGMVLAILLFDLFYFSLLLLVDCREKGNHRKTYKAGFAKFFMVRYTKKIEPTWEEWQEIQKKRQKREKCPVNSSTISRLSFWMQIVHLLYLVAFITVGVLYVVLETDSLKLATQIISIVFLAFIPISYIAYFIRMAKIDKGKKSTNNKE